MGACVRLSSGGLGMMHLNETFKGFSPVEGLITEWVLNEFILHYVSGGSRSGSHVVKALLALFQDSTRYHMRTDIGM